MEKHLYSREQRVLLNLLHETRPEAGLRQEDVTSRLGRPQSFVSKYESGERRFDVLELWSVCGVLGIALAEFAAELESRLGDVG